MQQKITDTLAIPEVVISHVLGFFNSVTTGREIVGRIIDDPGFRRQGRAYGIRSDVARRIWDLRDAGFGVWGPGFFVRGGSRKLRGGGVTCLCAYLLALLWQCFIILKNTKNIASLAWLLLLELVF